MKDEDLGGGYRPSWRCGGGSSLTWRRREVRELGLREAEDGAIFLAARRERAVVVTKDADFAALLERLGPPPQIVWITCGNTSNAVLRGVLERSFPDARRLLEAGEALVEIAR